MINKTEAGRIAAAINMLRPDWPIGQLMTLIGELKHWPLRDLATALVYLALDQHADGSWVSASPYRVKEDGPWRYADPETLAARQRSRREYVARMTEQEVRKLRIRECSRCDDSGYLPSGNVCPHLDPDRNAEARAAARQKLLEAQANPRSRAEAATLDQ